MASASESQIHDAICEFLAWHRLLFHHSPNELDMAGEKAARAVAKAKRKGMRPGWGDFEIIRGGKFYMLEVKTDRGRQTKKQEEIERLVIQNGGHYRVVRSVTDVEQALKEWRIISGSF